MINKKLMRKWIANLRSRKYKQGFGRLRQKGPTPRSVDRFCYLGVLCDIVNSKRWVETYRGYEYEGISVTLSSNVLNLIGEIHLYTLINMNDIAKKRFYEIADYLEKTYLNS